MSKKVLKSVEAPKAKGFPEVLRPIDQELGERPAAKTSGHRISRRMAGVRERAQREGFEQGLREGMARGLEEGRELGRREAREEAEARYAAEIDRFVEDLRESVAAVGFALERWFQQAEEALTGLAIAIAERVVASELATRPEAVLAIAREALAEVRGAHEAVLRVNPFVSDLVRARRAELLERARGVRGLEIVDDESIEAGCVVESELGIIDATVQSRLAAYVELLEKAA